MCRPAPPKQSPLDNLSDADVGLRRQDGEGDAAAVAEPPQQGLPVGAALVEDAGSVQLQGSGVLPQQPVSREECSHHYFIRSFRCDWLSAKP